MFYPNFEEHYTNFFFGLSKQTDWYDTPFFVHLVMGQNGNYDRWLNDINKQENSVKGFINDMWVSDNGVMKISRSTRALFVAMPQSLEENPLLEPLSVKMMYNIDVYKNVWSGMLNDIKPWTYYEPDLS